MKKDRADRITLYVDRKVYQEYRVHKYCGGNDFKIVDIKNCKVLW